MWKNGAVKTKLEVTIPNPTYLYYLVLSCTWMYFVHSCEKESLVIIPHGASFLGLYWLVLLSPDMFKVLDLAESWH